MVDNSKENNIFGREISIFTCHNYVRHACFWRPKTLLLRQISASISLCLMTCIILPTFALLVSSPALAQENSDNFTFPVADTRPPGYGYIQADGFVVLENSRNNTTVKVTQEACGDCCPTPSGNGPLGYAYVRADGSVDPDNSFNITSENISVLNDNGLPLAGIYGFRNLPFTPRNVQVTLAFDSQAVTGDNRTGSRGFIGDCSFVGGVDQACVSINSDPTISASTRGDDFFVVFF